MKLNSLKDKSVWITGASSGIGYELALQAAEAGASLLLISSRHEALAEIGRLCTAQGAKAVYCKSVDLSRSALVDKVVNEILTEHGAPDYLILNAGISQRSLTAETDLSVMRRIMDLNFFGAAAVARVVLPEMVKAGGGHIGVTSSLVGRFGFPMRSAYSASKNALHGFFETIALEYHSAGIRITLVLPGRIRTSISMNSLDGQGRSRGVMDPGQEGGMSPRLCAKKYWRAVLKGRREAVIGGSERLMLFFHRYIPWLFRVIARKANPF